VIPFVDLKAQYYNIKQEIDAAVASVLQTGQFVLGDEVTAFEKKFAAYCQARYGIAVNSGTSALHLALLAAGVGPDDEVITVPFTFVATVAAICYTGARPVFLDIEPRSYTLDVTQLESAITPRTNPARRGGGRTHADLALPRAADGSSGMRTTPSTSAVCGNWLVPGSGCAAGPD